MRFFRRQEGRVQYPLATSCSKKEEEGSWAWIKEASTQMLTRGDSEFAFLVKK